MVYGGGGSYDYKNNTTTSGGSGRGPNVEVYRKNGVPQIRTKTKGSSSTTSKIPSHSVDDSMFKKKTNKNAGKRTTYRFQEFDRYKAKDKDPNKFSDKVSQKSGVLKDVHDLKKIKGAAERRTFREKKHLYLGKYYGPDQFKGNKSLNKAWEKAGRPDANSFLRNRSRTGRTGNPNG